MSIRYWSPTYEVLEAARSMDRLFDTFFGPGGTTAPQGREGELPTYNLPVDVLENDGEYVLTAAVAGFRPDQVEVTWHEGMLTIYAKAEPIEWNGQWLRRERPYGNFARRLELPESVETGRIQASFDSGLLTVRVPKTPKPEPVKIPIGGAQRQIDS